MNNGVEVCTAHVYDIYYQVMFFFSCFFRCGLFGGVFFFLVACFCWRAFFFFVFVFCFFFFSFSRVWILPVTAMAIMEYLQNLSDEAHGK